jgi:molybdopterin molybdotransferase
MISVEEAQELILQHVTPPAVSNQVPLSQALDRVLAQDLASDVNIPPFTNTSMDGYAVRAADTENASPQHPIHLPVVAEISAGHPYPNTLAPHCAAKIMTGAPVPDGADAVVPIEWTQSSGPHQVAITRPVRPGDHVRYEGSDIKKGAVWLRRGTLITPPVIGILATMGYALVPVYPKPRLAIIATGDELREPGARLEPGTIRNSNSYAIMAAAQAAGAAPRVYPPVPDDADAIRQVFLAAQAEADLIVSSGGVSVGDFDLVKRVVEELGALTFWRVNVKPGKPVAFGRVGTVPVLGLPGNPVSALITFELFVRPIIRTWLGDLKWARPIVNLPLYEGFDEVSDRRHYVRSRLVVKDGQLFLWPHREQGSAIQSSWADVDALMIVPEQTGPLRKGQVMPAMLLSLHAL